MRQFPAMRINAILRGPGAAALLLGLMCAPANSAPNIDVLCDRSDDPSSSLEVSVDEFSIEVVDHGGSSGVASVPSNVPGSAVSALQPKSPSVDTILRQIFDESTPRDPAIPQSDVDRQATAAPLAELTAPEPDEIPADTLDSESSDNSEDGEAVGVHAQFPGLSNADTERYRQQMFRTDI